ncbi:MAG: hypothetical protein ACC641_11730 [Acidiferrobacterales bacterium]
MTRTNLDRYTQAIDYIRQNIDLALADRLSQKASARKELLGKAISLQGGGFWSTGTPGHHKALRALLLCQQVYLRPPEYRADKAKDGSETKNYFKTKGEEQVKEAIRSYTQVSNVTLEAFAQAALKITDPAKPFNELTRMRSDMGFGGITNCYGAVKMWLFNSGCCSLPWFLTEGAKINAYTVNNIIGNGMPVDEKNIDDIQRGYIFNLQDSKNLDVCHWGVSLGDGWAAASNTTPGEIDPVSGKPVMVDFRKGNTAYGEFALKSALEVCKLKYDSHVVTIKALDPTHGSNYY